MTDNTESTTTGWEENVSAPLRAEQRAVAARNVAGPGLGLTREEHVQALVMRCLEASQDAHEGRFDTERAQNTAAMFLTAELQLTMFLGDIELRAKESKYEIERVEAEAYFQLKSNTTGKITESALTQSIAREKEVVKSKKACAAAEADAKKWNNLLGVLKDGHIYFRNLGKTNNIT